jgi:hypothetical protein
LGQVRRAESVATFFTFLSHPFSPKETRLDDLAELGRELNCHEDLSNDKVRESRNDRDAHLFEEGNRTPRHGGDVSEDVMAGEHNGVHNDNGGDELCRVVLGVKVRDLGAELRPWDGAKGVALELGIWDAAR